MTAAGAAFVPRHHAFDGPYATAETGEKRIAVLAGRIEGLISQEHTKWVSAQEQAIAGDRAAGSHPIPADENKVPA